jgi:hypothetical protein
MQANEQEPNKKKKKGLLSEKMGLDQGSETFAPPMAQPGIFPGSAEAELNERSRDEVVSDKVRSRMKDRRSPPNGR